MDGVFAIGAVAVASGPRWQLLTLIPATTAIMPKQYAARGNLEIIMGSPWMECGYKDWNDSL